jgi:hypothetical protein
VAELSIECLWHEIKAAHFRGRAAAGTIDALLYSLRQRGTAALSEPDTQRRIGELSEEQIHDVGSRLQRLKPEIAKAWTAEDIGRLVEAWAVCHA